MRQTQGKEERFKIKSTKTEKKYFTSLEDKFEEISFKKQKKGKEMKI